MTNTILKDNLGDLEFEKSRITREHEEYKNTRPVLEEKDTDDINNSVPL
jgi:hypothetical protein